MATTSTGASGLTAAFLPVLKANIDRQEQFNSVTTEVARQTEAQSVRSLQIAASPSNDTASAVLSGRGQKLDVTA
ncbi:MAG: hypothetical protein JNN22_11265 [Rhodospirillales bacterium]|nr:hypothetical protein [Rhodospirillales bacterium]